VQRICQGFRIFFLGKGVDGDARLGRSKLRNEALRSGGLVDVKDNAVTRLVARVEQTEGKC